MAEENDTLLALTAEIVSAHVSNNSVAVNDVPNLVRQVHAALFGLGAPAQPAAPDKPEPRVSIRSSVKPDYIVCLEDGKKLKMLKRYLRTNFQMTPEEYRQKWGLKANYPMVAPNYAEQRRDLAMKIGLGTKGRSRSAAAPSGSDGSKPARRGRRPKASATNGERAGED